MIEVIVLQYLKKIVEVPVLMEQPVVPEEFETMPERYIVLEKIAGGNKNHIQSASVAIQSYANSLAEAAELDEIARKAMDNIIILNNVSASHMASNYNHPDSTRKQYRYQCVYDLTYFE